MPELTCPECHAAINPDLVNDSGSVECPFCNHTWSLLQLPQTKFPPVDPGSVTGVSRSISGMATKIDFPGLPPGSRIKIVEAAEDRLLLYIPGGGKSASGLGCFAVLWNGFMCIFNLVAIFGELKAGEDAAPLWGIVAFLSLFWAIGLGIGWFWIKLKYERTILLVERDRLVIQRVLFNRKRVEETLLTPDSRAALVESYQQNDDPVYRIEVPGVDRSAKFGTALAPAEKDWTVDRINDFLGRGGAWALETPPSAQERAAAVAALPASCKHCGAPLTGEMVKGAVTCAHCGGVFRTAVTRPAGAIPVAPVEHLIPADLPAGSPLLIDEDHRDALEFYFQMTSGSPARWIVPVVTFPFSLAWYGIVFAFVGGAWQAPFLPVRILAIVFSVPFLLAGLLPFLIGLFMLRGKTVIRLTPETLACRWEAVPFRYSRSVATNAIEEIKVQVLTPAQPNPRVRRAGATKGGPEWKVCTARAGGKTLYLSFGLDQIAAGQIAALLRTRLEDWGHVLADA